MDMWTDLNLSTEWGLDLWDQPNGLFGDLKPVSHLEGDMDPACKPRDAVQMTSPSSEDNLGFEWMESGDLGSFLDALDNGQGKLLPMEENLFDCSQDCASKDIVSVNDTKLTVNFLENYQIIGNDFVQGLTPPESPEQVTPVIQLHSEINESNWSSDIPTPVSPQEYLDSPVETSITSEPPLVQYESPDFLLGDQLDVKPAVLDASDILGFSLTAYDGNLLDQLDSNDHSGSEVINFSYSSGGDSIVLSSTKAVSPKPSIDNLIQTSPELYKVIATPTNLSARISPYCRTKEHKVNGGAKSSKSKKALSSPEPVSEEEFSSPLGKKERKKLQNKNAAIRYRQKKKAEGECIFNEVQGLMDKNKDLKTKVDDLQREIKYMKSLMEDIYKAKGLVR